MAAVASRRDPQSAVYRTEDIITAALEDGGSVVMFGQHFELPDSGQRRFARVEDITRYLDALWQMPWVREYEIPQPQVRVRKGQAKAVYEGRRHTIAIPEAKWALTEMVVLHEVAHSLTRGDGHGERFRRVYADLASRAIDPVLGIMLNYHFDQELEEEC